MSGHALAIAGLAMNMAGTLLLLAYPTPVALTGPLSPEQNASLRIVLDGARRSYRIRLSSYYAGITLLAIGFLLQLIDLTRT